MSQLEEALRMQIKAAGLPAPATEHPFCAGLGWRFDLCYPIGKVGIEVEGGTWLAGGGGRHNRGQGFSDDCRKYAIAALLGWTLIRVTREMIESGEALALLEAALGRRDVDTLIQRRRQEIAEKRRAGARKGWITRQSRQGDPR